MPRRQCYCPPPSVPQISQNYPRSLVSSSPIQHPLREPPPPPPQYIYTTATTLIRQIIARRNLHKFALPAPQTPIQTHEPRETPPPMAHNFISLLPTVPLPALKNGTKCPICGSDYGTRIPGSDTAPEDAVRLPCSHGFGHVCLSTWLTPSQQGSNKPTCPLCRRELFPAPSSPLAEAGAEAEEAAIIPSSQHDDDLIINRDSMARDLDTQLSASGIEQRSAPFRDWLLYAQLRGQGARLPAWRPSSGGGGGGGSPGPRLDAEQEGALFGELRRRGAFRLVPVGVGPLVSDREVWGVLRGMGYVYDAGCAARADGCAWLRFESV